ncbi:MAG: hypothetical protein ACODAC_06980 [Pseudomonadota bacterium]
MPCNAHLKPRLHHREAELNEWSINEVAGARDAVITLLEAVPLETYLFEVEPTDEHWEVRLEWGREEAWNTATLSAGRDELLDALRDKQVRDAVLHRWRRCLGIGTRHAISRARD